MKRYDFKLNGKAFTGERFGDNTTVYCEDGKEYLVSSGNKATVKKEIRLFLEGVKNYNVIER